MLGDRKIFLCRQRFLLKKCWSWKIFCPVEKTGNELQDKVELLSQQNDTLLKENSEIKADNKKLSEKLEKNTEELSTLKQAYLKLAEQIKSLLPSRN